MRTTVNMVAATALGTAVWLTGCGKPDPTQATPKAVTANAAWLLELAPAGAQAVTAAKTDAKQGQQIVVTGRIGGRDEPITADSPVFTIVDTAIPHCRQNKGDGCPTPWDYCCETPASIAANSATVQLVDKDGKALDVDPIAAGLKPLDEVVVVGTVGPRPHADVLMIKATGVHRRGG